MYSHLTKQQRIEFGALRRTGLSLRAVARLLGCHHSTLSRELQRNPPMSGRYEAMRYHASDAHWRTKTRRLAANQRFRKVVPGSALEQLLIQKIRQLKWAPEQCAGWLKTYRPSLYVCTQTIYSWIHTAHKELRQYLHCLKRTLRRTRQANDRKTIRQEYAALRHISWRSAVVATRQRYGDWEGDTIFMERAKAAT